MALKPLTTKQVTKLLNLLTEQMQYNVATTGVLISLIDGERQEAIDELRVAIQHSKAMQTIATQFAKDFLEAVMEEPDVED